MFFSGSILIHSRNGIEPLFFFRNVLFVRCKISLKIHYLNNLKFFANVEFVM